MFEDAAIICSNVAQRRSNVAQPQIWARLHQYTFKYGDTYSFTRYSIPNIHQPITTVNCAGIHKYIQQALKYLSNYHTREFLHIIYIYIYIYISIWGWRVKEQYCRWNSHLHNAQNRETWGEGSNRETWEGGYAPRLLMVLTSFTLIFVLQCNLQAWMNQTVRL